MTAPPLALLITTGGLNRFTAAQLDDDIDLDVASVGLTASTFVIAPTLTGLPGEIKRISTIAGQAVDAHTVHLTARDDSTDTYQVRALGLYLADGTLFALYGGNDVIVEKSALSVALFSLDLTFPQGVVDMIQFGDTSFIYPPATESVKGVAEIATQAETNAGTDDVRFVTPLKLAVRLAAAIANFVTSARRVDSGGLATGGGDLSADRTITVPKASQAEAAAGTSDAKACTPFSLAGIFFSIADSISAMVPSVRAIASGGLATGGGNLSADRTITVPKASATEVFAGTSDLKAATPLSLAALATIAPEGSYPLPGGLVLKWGTRSAAIAARGNIAFDFPAPFPTACFGVLGIVRNTGSVTSGGVSTMQEVSVSATGAVLRAQNEDTATSDIAGGFRWLAWGN